MAYVLGFFAADGCITVNSRGGQYFAIQIADLNLLTIIRKVLGSEHKITRRVHLKNKGVFFRLQIGSGEICEDLRELGFAERKTKNMCVPLVPKKYFADFVRGYFDGDGNVWVGFVHKNKEKSNLTIQTMFTSCSLEFLKQLHKKLFNFGIKGGSIYVSKDKYCRLQLSVSDSLKLYNIMYNQDIKYGLFLERKRKVFDRYIKSKHSFAAVAQR